jgi:hypothetical protein
VRFGGRGGDVSGGKARKVQGYLQEKPPMTMEGFRGAEGDRTPDLVNAIHALSQLSYSPGCVN